MLQTNIKTPGSRMFLSILKNITKLQHNAWITWECNEKTGVKNDQMSGSLIQVFVAGILNVPHVLG